jgi:putative transposase
MYSCKYHIVWCPKYRRSVLVNGVDKRLKEIIQQSAAEFQATVIELEIMPDHGSVVHLWPSRASLMRGRPAGWCTSASAQLAGALVAAVAARVSLAALSPADSVDALVFCVHRGRCAIVDHQTIYRKPEERLNGP